MRTKVKLDKFDLTVYPGGFSFWHKGICIIDASKFGENREVIFREGGDARLRATVINVNSSHQGPPTVESIVRANALDLDNNAFAEAGV